MLLTPVSADGQLLPGLRKSTNELEPEQRSADDSINTAVNTAAQEKVNDPQGSTESRLAADAHGPRSERWAKLKASLFIIVGTFLLQAAAWTLFGVICSRGPITLSYIPTPLGMKAFTYLGSTITGVLASLSSFFFSRAVLQHISVRMHDKGMSLADFVSSGQIASRSFVGDRTNLKLTTLSLIVLLLTSQVAPGWNGLMLPQFFTGYTNSVTGRELDLGNLLLRNLSGDAIDFCAFNTSDLPTLTVGQTDNGVAAMNQALGVPVSLNLMNFAFNTSTGGILPLVFDKFDISLWFTNATTTTTPWTIPWTLSPNISLHNRISATTSMHQQGFSVDPTCTFQDLKPDTTPSLVFENVTLDSGNSSSFPVTSLRMSSNCAAPNGPTLINTTTVDISNDPGSGSVLMIACRGSDSESYTLIFSGSGLYDFMKTMVCTLTPKIPQVLVTTTYGDGGGTVRTYPLAGGVAAPWGLPAVSAVTRIYRMMYFAQGVQTNIMGNQVKEMASVHAYSPLDATAAYLRGVTEYSGSVFRACLSAKGGGISADGVPQNMTISVRAHLETQYFGWMLNWFTSLLLLPGTFIAFATLYVVYLTWQHHPLDRKSTFLDPADTMHIVAASAAGGLTGILNGTDEDKKVHIVVGGFDAPNGRVEPALIAKA
ncbi:hypothetical protein DFH06DRAFT_1333293 [Mycena polygramma]|nr:hypothetical protein DFH06DRAFT_1333293 [Mycena polygramma]